MPAEEGSSEVKGQLSNLRVALDLFTELRTILRVDVERALQDAEDAAAKGTTGQDLQRLRRNAARALFSYIEAVVYAMKRTALRMEEILPAKMFKPHEVAQLEEQRPPWPTAKDNLKFAFDAFVRRHGGYVFEPRGRGWDAYCRASDIRDHLMHPKSVTHVTIDGAQCAGLVQTWIWINTEFDKAARVVHDRAKGRAVELQAKRTSPSSP